ncbi:hypothetical protein [Vibrio fluminensis]|uniref:hypothetical protein n=1 Tax=Vibrio fluminensis TaxID=2783614 RepID=UPI0018888A45|nr:hypothetical protein [Vibrio fluminensis]
MPLYTYVVSYNDSRYVGQGSHSNFKGFVNAWCTDLPVNALRGLTPSLKKELGKLAFKGVFTSVPNRQNVWEKTIDLNGKLFHVYAIETRK